LVVGVHHTSRTITVYTIDERRSHEVVVGVLGKEFRGVLISEVIVLQPTTIGRFPNG
jgi:hypothetical protein